MRGLADLQRIYVDWLGNILQLGKAEIAHLEIEPPLHLPVGLLGETDRAGFGDAFQPRSDIHAVAHEIAVTLLDHVAEVDADPKLDALFWGNAHVALGHAVLHLNRATYGIDHAAKFHERPIAGALHDPPVMH